MRRIFPPALAVLALLSLVSWSCRSDDPAPQPSSAAQGGSGTPPPTPEATGPDGPLSPPELPRLALEMGLYGDTPSLAWSPDGRQLLFNASWMPETEGEAPAGLQGVYAFHRDSSSIRLVSPEPRYEPLWLPGDLVVSRCPESASGRCTPGLALDGGPAGNTGLVAGDARRLMRFRDGKLGWFDGAEGRWRALDLTQGETYLLPETDPWEPPGPSWQRCMAPAAAPVEQRRRERGVSTTPGLWLRAEERVLDEASPWEFARRGPEHVPAAHRGPVDPCVSPDGRWVAWLARGVPGLSLRVWQLSDEPRPEQSDFVGVIEDEQCQPSGPQPVCLQYRASLTLLGGTLQGRLSVRGWQIDLDLPITAHPVDDGLHLVAAGDGGGLFRPRELLLRAVRRPEGPSDGRVLGEAEPGPWDLHWAAHPLRPIDVTAHGPLVTLGLYGGTPSLAWSADSQSLAIGDALPPGRSGPAPAERVGMWTWRAGRPEAVQRIAEEGRHHVSWADSESLSSVCQGGPCQPGLWIHPLEGEARRLLEEPVPYALGMGERLLAVLGTDGRWTERDSVSGEPWDSDLSGTAWQLPLELTDEQCLRQQGRLRTWADAEGLWMQAGPWPALRLDSTPVWRYTPPPQAPRSGPQPVPPCLSHDGRHLAWLADSGDDGPELRVVSIPRPRWEENQ